MQNLRTMVLNSDMTPIEYPYTAISARNAVERVISGTCVVAESYPYEIGCVDPMKLIEYDLLYWPSIVIRKGKIARRAVSTPNLNLKNLHIRDNGICAYSGDTISLEESSIDHVIPTSKGGKNAWNNVVLARADLNHAKGNSMPVGRWKPIHNPFTPSHWDLLKNIRKRAITVDHESWIPYLGKWEGEVKIKKF